MKARTIIMIAGPFFLALTLVSFAAIYYLGSTRSAGTHYVNVQRVTINGKPLTIEVVSTREEQRQGLGDRDGIPQRHGMLFVFPETRVYPFWMRRMRFPIDMIWMRDGVVVEISENVQPPKFVMDVPKTVTPVETADRVLELNAGMARAYGLATGTRVDMLAEIW
jgi:hypothetical protein